MPDTLLRPFKSNSCQATDGISKVVAMYRKAVKVGPVILSALGLFIGGFFPTVGVAQTGSAFQWTVTERPPELTNPKHVDMSVHGTSSIGGWGKHCGGKVYKVNLGDSEDAIISMSGTQPLRYPLRVMGGRNVHIVGLHFDLITQSGCDIGELPNEPVDQYPNANIHPRIPGGIAMRLEQSGTTFVEGVFLDMRGHEADCFVARNPDWMSGAQAREQRHLIFQNSTCLGNEGQGGWYSRISLTARARMA